ncbi:collagen, type III, alpha [Evansella caseinilytica]|uniref:Collagen, type III, alpha n=1 Tax=Evansella caseinilytica TaxID=1503961 RepID=A0A1H3PNI4_9BACI|nr:hypothetical protein [Evansella caseinilytica]SDZ02511.1 collagen, type III, alpha [Evansella caseinilytica]
MSCNCNSPKGYAKSHVSPMPLGAQMMPKYKAAPVHDENMMYGQPVQPFSGPMMPHPAGMSPGMGAVPGPGFAPMHGPYGMGYPVPGYPAQPQPYPTPHPYPAPQTGYVMPQSHAPINYGYGTVPGEPLTGHGGHYGPPGAYPTPVAPQAPSPTPGMPSSPGALPPTGYMPEEDDDFD